VPLGDLVASVDVYTGRHEGLRVVEVEFDSEHGQHARFTPHRDWSAP